MTASVLTAYNHLGRFRALKAAKWSIMRRRKLVAIVFVCTLLAIGLVGGTRYLVWWYDWYVIQKATELKQVSDLSGIEIHFGPSLTNRLWALVRCTVPARRVESFVDANQCEPSDRISLQRYRRALPEDVQTLPATGERFYKSGATTSGKPFELLVSSRGDVVLYVMFDD